MFTCYYNNSYLGEVSLTKAFEMVSRGANRVTLPDGLTIFSDDSYQSPSVKNYGNVFLDMNEIEKNSMSGLMY